jgi:hypothetical protein
MDGSVSLWKRAGIDLKAGFAASEKQAQKEMALTSKSEAKQGTLIEVKKGKKKAKR